MKICVISTTIMACPPPAYSGLEMLAWQQAVGLADKGHQVMLIAPSGSSVPANVELHGTTLHEPEKQAYGGYWNKLLNFDCIIDHSWEKWSVVLRMEGKLKAPSLLWLHAPINTMYGTSPPIDKPCLVSISKDQADHVRECLQREARVVYNGVDASFYRITNLPRSDRYLFLARMSSIKGPDIAVEVAAACNVGLDLIGDDRMTGEPDLMNMLQQQCCFNPKLRYVGLQKREDCAIWFNSNKALLHPNKRFREPFGLAPVEAQLCGMPVIAWNYGAMRETIKHGETGFLVNSEQEIEALLKADAVSTIDRNRCREWAMQFSYQNMIDRCETLCREAVETGGW